MTGIFARFSITIWMNIPRQDVAGSIMHIRREILVICGLCDVYDATKKFYGGF